MSSQQVMPLRHLISPSSTVSKASTTTAGPSTSESPVADNKPTSEKTLKEEEEVERQKMQYVLMPKFLWRHCNKLSKCDGVN